MVTELPTYNRILVILIDLTAIWLANLMIRHSKRNPTTKAFLAMTISMFLWVNFSFLARLFAHYNPSLVITFLRIAWFATPFLFVFLYFFILNLIGQPKSHPRLNLAVILGAIIIATLSGFTDFVVNSVRFVGVYLTINYGSAMFLYLGIGISLFVAPIYVLFKNYKRIPEQLKSKIRLILVGVFIFYFANLVFNVILPIFFKINRFYFIGDYSTIIMLSFIAFAIVKHGLFNTKVITTEAIVVVLSIGLFAEIFMTENLLTAFTKAIVWALATFGGIQLAKSVKNEIEQKEKIDKIAEDLKKANDHLKDLDKLKDNFLSMASHELNTPIAAIEGYLSMMLDEGMAGKLSEKAVKYLRIVFASSKRLSRLVTELLNVSRIESGRIHLIYDHNPLEDTINNAVMEVMSKAREANHKLTFDKPKKALPATWYDQTRITEVLINIIGNAIKYTDPGGKIVVSSFCDDDKIVVSVKDNGRGIPKEAEKGVFEKFTQVDVLKDQSKGTGLGMYISKNFVELHKGKIWFHSEGEGKGTEFFFSLPILKKKPYDPHEGEGAVLH